MKKEEKALLLGIYNNMRELDVPRMYRPEEINWLVKNGVGKAKDWVDEKMSELKTFEPKHTKRDEHFSYLDDLILNNNYSLPYLSYLKEKGLITYEKHEPWFLITVTGKGADLAREIETPIKRLNYFILNHKKHSLSGLLLTGAVILIGYVFKEFVGIETVKELIINALKSTTSI